MNQFNNKLSVYIPHVSCEWANTNKITERFNLYEIGLVERVDLVLKPNTGSEPYYHAFVHFDMWHDTPATRNLQERIFDPNRQARLVYDDPKYWILLKNKNPMTEIEVRMEKRIEELESNSKQMKTVELGHLERIMNLETQVFGLMNYWNDPELHKFRSCSDNSVTTNDIYPLWCHPTNQCGEDQPIWNTNLDDLETGMTMSDYAVKAATLQQGGNNHHYD